MLWLANLNPAGKTRRKKRSRKLWGAALAAHLKKTGGGHKRKRRKSSGRRRRKLWGAALAAHLKKTGKPARKRGRGSRRRALSVISKVSTMAVRHKKRRKSRKGRRARRNSWRKQPRRHRKAAKLGHARRRRHFKANAFQPNAVLATQWNRGKKRRKSHARRNPRRRHYRRNSVLATQWNPGGVLGGVLGKTGRFMSVQFWTQTALPGVAGFIGTKAVGTTLFDFVNDKVLHLSAADAVYPWARLGADVVGLSALTYGINRFVSRSMSENVFLGGAFSIAISVLKLLLPADIQSKVGLAGIGNGDDLSSRMRQAVANRVQADLAGMGTYLNEGDLRQRTAQGMGEFLTEDRLRSRGAYSPSQGGVVEHSLMGGAAF